MRLKHRSLKASYGYTLIELMIVVTMIGIVASLAVSSFTGYTASADRADAQSDLYELAQVMERAFTSDRTYADVNMTQALLNFTSSSRYTYSMGAQTATTYQIDAEVDDSRDDYDLSLDNVGIERFRITGGSTWSATTGWNNID